MAKEWTCTQCGKVQTRTIVTHVTKGAPAECEACGNTKFEETTLGSTHSLLDNVLS